LAAEALRQSIAVNPWRADYHLALARNCAQARDWLGAIAACRQAIRLNPELHEARSMLVRCYVASGEADQADAEFLILLELQPASRDLWRRWYAQLKQTQRSP
jgi:Flp pilus assembly protein TadD